MFKHFSKATGQLQAAGELQAAFLKRTRGYCICTSHLALQYILQKEGFGKSAQTIKHFARCKINTVK
jgi:hypothetical protein